MATIPGDEPATAWRLFVAPTCHGYIRVQQLGHNPQLGWYVQKSMVLPRDVLAALVPQLRKALCLIPSAPARQSPVPAPDFMRIVNDSEQAA